MYRIDLDVDHAGSATKIAGFSLFPHSIIYIDLMQDRQKQTLRIAVAARIFLVILEFSILCYLRVFIKITIEGFRLCAAIGTVILNNARHVGNYYYYL